VVGVGVVGVVVPRSRDAVIVVPGIMGSELVEVESGRVLWGLADPRWYVSAWTSGSSLGALRLSDAERAGRYGRVRARRLLRFPAFAPLLAGFLPYTAVLKGLRSVVWHPDAVAEFAYDWRLPVAYNGDLLAQFARRHLATWQAHPEQVAAAGVDPDGDRPARVVLVAHSMGGLLARHACQDGGLGELVRATVTVGTPFFGAPKAVLLLGQGRGSPLPIPRARVRRLAVTLPGVYDLLPSYRCVSDGPSARRMTASDVVGLGGDGELAVASFASRERVSVALRGHVQVVGAYQPTVQALTIEGGTVIGHRFTYQPCGEGVVRVDAGGDGTVPRESAQLPSGSAMPLAQSHGALASSAEAVVVVRDVVTDRRSGPWLGVGELGLEVPDVVGAGQPYWVGITGVEHPTEVRCAVVDVGSGLRVDTPVVGRRDGAVVARAQPLPPGLYWVRIDGGGASPVTQILMSTLSPESGPDGGEPAGSGCGGSGG
jgi:Lecithin:cholesterol acyltransferase